jgi:hypothetical protein
MRRLSTESCCGEDVRGADIRCLARIRGVDDLGLIVMRSRVLVMPVIA